MPLYEYECEVCGRRFEQIQKFSDPLVENCPLCGGAVHKLMSLPAIQFKGSGWYVTDYARKGQSTEAKEEQKKPEDSAARDPSSPSSTSTSSSTPAKTSSGSSSSDS